MANGSTMVLPPKAAERVPEAKSSAMTMPGPDGWAMWTWLSMPPGSTSLPRASTILGRVAEIVAQRRDPAAADADVAGKRVGRGRDRAAADDGVEGHGNSSSIVFSFFFTCEFRPAKLTPEV